MKKYSQDHEWVEVKDGVATVGISTYAADELGDVTFVELPDVGQTIAVGDSVGVVESVKAASDIYSPVSGTIKEVNGKLEEAPEVLNTDAEGAGWICQLEDINEADLESLMSEEEYEEFTGK